MTHTDSFYMIHGDSGGAPTKRHATRGLALAEAERLAVNNPGRRFFVLRAECAVETATAPVTVSTLVDKAAEE